MDEGRFWDIVARAQRAGGDDMEQRCEALRAALTALPLEDVAAFDATFRRLHDGLYSWDLWGAAYVVHGGCSDDGFIDFRTWVVSEGRETYDVARRDPDALADHIRTLDPLEEAELYAYVASEVHEEREGGEIERADADAVADGGEPSGTPWDEDDEDALAARYPRLAALVARLGGGPEAPAHG